MTPEQAEEMLRLLKSIDTRLSLLSVKVGVGVILILYTLVVWGGHQ